MARANKKRVDGFVFPAPFAVGVVLVSGLALVYVWMGGRCEAMGKELKGLETDKKELAKKFQAEEFRWSRMKSPASVEHALVRHGVTMNWPRKDQIVRLSENDVRFDQRAADVARGAPRSKETQRPL